VPHAEDAGDLLRSHGLRVTRQRRAILAAFSDAAAEHLSADEVHARAAAVVPELGRGTVYATLAELTEIGILIARGSPEPVRYETNTEAHQHFRCRLCLRLFDVEISNPPTDDLTRERFVVEQVAVTAEGVCAECVDYDRGLRAAATRARSRPSDLPADIAAATTETPVGTLTLAATPSGVVRVVFDHHADVPALNKAIRRRRGNRSAKHHIAAAKTAVADYVAGHSPRECQIDWDSLDGRQTLRAVAAVPRAHEASYHLLETPADAAERGRIIGANPLAILIPCHRVTRGREVPVEYVGGAGQRQRLLEFERSGECPL
jgi:Fur family transcriptional regulator, stress-responsive regulator